MANELILTLDSERPLSAEELGAVFSALARDYREMTRGRSLVVVRVESGSIIAILTDAALAVAPYAAGSLAVIGGINALFEFAKNLNKWFGYAKKPRNEHEGLYRGEERSPGQRSVEEIIKIAAKTRSHVRVQHKTERGETLDVELTPQEAKSARKQLRAKGGTKKIRRTTTTATLSDEQVEDAIAHMRRMWESSPSPAEAHPVVEAIVAVLKATGAGSLLPKIASELEIRGLHEIAHAVRQHIRPTSGTHESPPPRGKQ